jgi:hypothetical protein
MTGRNSYVVVFKAEYEAGKLWDGVGHGHALHQGVDASFQRRPLASLRDKFSSGSTARSLKEDL